MMATNNNTLWTKNWEDEPLPKYVLNNLAV